MDVKIKDGDIVTDASGNALCTQGIDEILQRVLFCITTKKGSFIYNKDFGCEEIGEITDERSIRNTEALIREAAVSVRGAEIILDYAENTESGVKLGFTLSFDGEIINSEVTVE